MAERNAAHAALRSGTAPDHERLDGLFAHFDLSDRAAYRAFLTAHALALPSVEQALDAGGFAAMLPDWPDRKRADALATDLAAVGGEVPAPLVPPALPSPAAMWGAAYVVEGSRLGGTMLARQIGEGLPKAYLGTPLPAGAWRYFLESLDAALSSEQDRTEATAAARATFALFETAGRQMTESDAA